MTAPDIHVHVHIDLPPGVDYNPRFDTLEEMLMTTKAELEVKVQELADAQAEAASDLTRILDTLAELVAAGDLTAIGEQVDLARGVAEAMSAAADAAVADPTDVPPPPPEPEPVPEV